MILRMNLIRLIAVLLTLGLGGSLAPAQAPAKSGTAKSSKKSAPVKAAPEKTTPETSALIDINRASAADLKTLPGIGDAYSAAIIKNRPYANKTQLQTKGVIPAAAYGKIKDKIIAKQ
jgi:competence protein ComEA